MYVKGQKISESATVVIIHLIQKMPVVCMSLESKYSERLLGSNVREQVLIVSWKSLYILLNKYNAIMNISENLD